MNSAALPDTPRSAPETSPWEDVRRIYRRICVLRAMGRIADAATLEHRDLSRALAAARLATAPEGLNDEAAVFAQEEDRVASAEVLADLVAPRIAEHLRTEVAPIAAPAARATGLPSAPAAAAIAPAPLATAPARPPGTDVPGIADLIDSMLAQQRGPGGSAR